MSRSAGRVLAVLDSPRLITHLSAAGNAITLESPLAGRTQPAATWHADNLHIFVVASLAVLLSVRSGSWKRLLRRLAWAVPLIFLFTLALTAVQLRTDLERYATSQFGVTVTTPAGKSFLNWGNYGLIMVGMLFLPAFLFLVSYVAAWSTRPPAWSGEPPAPAAEGAKHRLRGPMIYAVPAVWLFLLVMVFLPASPDPGDEEVRAGLERVVAMNPGSAQAHFALALHLEDRGKISESMLFYRKALELNPEMVNGWYDLGNTLLKRGDYAEAVETYEKELRRDPRHVAAQTGVGNARFQQGFYQDAVEAYRAALRIEENRPATHKNLAEALLRLERRCEALPHLRRSAELDGVLGADAHLRSRIVALERECGAHAGQEVVAPPAPR
jgi:tetratricopeptide (TPR) repeat protein